MNVLPPEDVSFFQNFKNQFFGIYPMTIDKDGVLMTRDFEKEKFEMIDQIIENHGGSGRNKPRLTPTFCLVEKKSYCPIELPKREI